MNASCERAPAEAERGRAGQGRAGQGRAGQETRRSRAESSRGSRVEPRGRDGADHRQFVHATATATATALHTRGRAGAPHNKQYVSVLPRERTASERRVCAPVISHVRVRLLLRILVTNSSTGTPVPVAPVPDTVAAGTAHADPAFGTRKDCCRAPSFCSTYPQPLLPATVRITIWST